MNHYRCLFSTTPKIVCVQIVTILTSGREEVLSIVSCSAGNDFIQVLHAFCARIACSLYIHIAQLFGDKKSFLYCYLTPQSFVKNYAQVHVIQSIENVLVTRHMKLTNVTALCCTFFMTENIATKGRNAYISRYHCTLLPTLSTEC